MGRPCSVSCSHPEQLVDELNLLPNVRTVHLLSGSSIEERERVPQVPAHGAKNQLGLGLSPPSISPARYVVTSRCPPKLQHNPRIRQEIAVPPFTGEGHRKFWARLRVSGVRTSKTRVLRLMREAQLLAPQRQAAPIAPPVLSAPEPHRPHRRPLEFVLSLVLEHRVNLELVRWILFSDIRIGWSPQLWRRARYSDGNGKERQLPKELLQSAEPTI